MDKVSGNPATLSNSDWTCLDFTVDRSEIGGLTTNDATVLLFYVLLTADHNSFRTLKFGHNDLWETYRSIISMIQVLMLTLNKEQELAHLLNESGQGGQERDKDVTLAFRLTQ